MDLRTSKRFDEIKIVLTEQHSNTISGSNQPFNAMCDAPIFGNGTALLQSQQGTNKNKLKSAKSTFFIQAEIRISTLMKGCTAIM